MVGMNGPSVAKKVTWIELYFDLVFVLAIARVAHVLEAGPGWRAVWTGLGIFAVLWWTWIGFALFYNRYGDESSRAQRLLIIAGTIPCGLAAVAVDDLAHGHRTAFILSMVAVRLLLAVAHIIRPGTVSTKVGAGYLVSAAGFAASIFLGGPWWWIVWALMLALEAVNLFAAPNPYEHLTETQNKQLQTNWRKAIEIIKPTSPEFALQGNHLAERFGLFIIIVLGEVVASSGAGALEAGGQIPWLTLAGAIGLSAVLWWLYFDAASVFNEKLLLMAGGAPSIARSTFAFGQMGPAFGLIMVAAALRQLIDGHADATAYWLLAVGVGVYLLFNRVDGELSWGWWLRFAAVLATFQLGWLYPVLPEQAYIWVVCAWMAACAYAVGNGGRRARARLEAKFDATA